MAAHRFVTDRSLSGETLECLVRTLEGAHVGNVTGVVIGIMLKHGDYTFGICGEAFRNPTVALGVADMMKDELRSIIHQRTHLGSTF